jgi:hypothetical protein
MVASLTAVLLLAASPLTGPTSTTSLAEARSQTVAGQGKQHHKDRKRWKRKARGKSRLSPVTRLTFSNQVVTTIRAEIWTLKDGYWSFATAAINGGQENRTLDVQAPCEAIACWIERKYFVGLQGLPAVPVATLGVGGTMVNGQWSGGTTIVNRAPLEELQETGMDAGTDYLRLIRASVDPSSLRFLLTYQHG